MEYICGCSDPSFINGKTNYEMLNKILTILAFCLITVLAYSQEVFEIQKPMLTKVTASWCPKCGTWGWEYMERAMQEHQDEILFAGAHYSGDLRTSAASFLASNFQSIGQPVFFLNNEDQVVFSSNVDDRLEELKTAVADLLNEAPIANSGLTVSSDGSKISVHTKTRFFQPSSGEYYLGVYVVENGVVNYQSGRGADAVHPFVIQAAMTPNEQGLLLMNGSIGAGMEFENDFNIDIDASWDLEKVHIYAIIWKSEGSVFEYVNGYSEQINESTSTGETESIGFSVKATPTILNERLTLQIASDIQRDLDVHVFSQQGQLITYDAIAVPQGNSTIQFASINLVTGLYLVKVFDGKEISTAKFIKL
jgi:hypothetical protein